MCVSRQGGVVWDLQGGRLSGAGGVFEQYLPSQRGDVEGARLARLQLR